MIHQLSFQQARNQSQHAFIWHARLRSGEVIWEQPGLSSDSLVADEVVGIDYVPCRPNLPRLEANIDLARGERFVRYWTSIWSPKGNGVQMLYVLGIERRERHALMCHYPGFNKIVLAAQRPFQPPWIPEPFGLLPKAAISLGGPGCQYFGWHHEGFGGYVEVLPDNRLTFRAIYG
jgi:hypothetical protein